MKKKLDVFSSDIVYYNSSARCGPVGLIALQLSAPANDRGREQGSEMKFLEENEI